MFCEDQHGFRKFRTFPLAENILEAYECGEFLALMLRDLTTAFYVSHSVLLENFAKHVVVAYVWETLSSYLLHRKWVASARGVVPKECAGIHCTQGALCWVPYYSLC